MIKLAVAGSMLISGVVPNMVITRVTANQAEVYSNSPTTEIRVLYKDGTTQYLFGCIQGCPVGSVDNIQTVQMEAE